MAENKRPVTCGELAASQPELGEKGCRRLPRHGGEHRATLTARQGRQKAAAKQRKVANKQVAPKGRKVTIAGRRKVVAELRSEVGAKARGRVTAAQRRDMMAALSSRVEAGSLGASDALGIAALF